MRGRQFFFRNLKKHFFGIKSEIYHSKIVLDSKRPQSCSEIFRPKIKIHFTYEFFKAGNFRNSVFYKKNTPSTIYGIYYLVDFKFFLKKKFRSKTRKSVTKIVIIYGIICCNLRFSHIVIMHVGWIIIICWQLDIPRISSVVIWFLRIVIFYSDLDTKKSFLWFLTFLIW